MITNYPKCLSIFNNQNEEKLEYLYIREPGVFFLSSYKWSDLDYLYKNRLENFDYFYDIAYININELPIRFQCRKEHLNQYERIIIQNIIKELYKFRYIPG